MLPRIVKERVRRGERRVLTGDVGSKTRCRLKMRVLSAMSVKGSHVAEAGMSSGPVLLRIHGLCRDSRAATVEIDSAERGDLEAGVIDAEAEAFPGRPNQP